eukprot:TRINITY_DN5515_c0_g1_i2.p1 TRINITY_DN5515_c0_g1~~TRINITY_DN5515_c0_g1_i2.p1  ORF type:complete len:286 (-),score=74.36 TRINITY_DN5515_c0_g1_i2:426-1283(-)
MFAIVFFFFVYLFDTLASVEDIKKELDDHIKGLHSEDQNVVAKAAAALVMMATLPLAEPYLLPAATQLASLFRTSCSIYVKRNACAALSAMMNSSEQNYKAIAGLPNLMEMILQCLESGDCDEGLQINVVSAISILAHRNEGLEIIREAEADTKLLTLLDSVDEAKLEEEIVDAICALAVHEEMRPPLVSKKAVPRIARKLKTDSSEICVRVLLVLGMLCGSSKEAQQELAETDDAVNKLFNLIKSHDPDIRGIAHDLFAVLSSNKDVKQKIELTLRRISSTKRK